MRPVLHDNRSPRYLPHIEHPRVLYMGLSPLGDKSWIDIVVHQHCIITFRVSQFVHCKAQFAGKGSTPRVSRAASL